MLRSKPLCHKSRLTTFNSTQTGWKQAKNINILGKVSAAQKKLVTQWLCRNPIWVTPKDISLWCVPIDTVYAAVSPPSSKLTQTCTVFDSSNNNINNPPRVRSTDRFPEAAKPLGVTRPKKYNSPSPKKVEPPRGVHQPWPRAEVQSAEQNIYLRIVGHCFQRLRRSPQRIIDL